MEKRICSHWSWQNTVRYINCFKIHWDVREQNGLCRSTWGTNLRKHMRIKQLRKQEPRRRKQSEMFWNEAMLSGSPQLMKLWAWDKFTEISGWRELLDDTCVIDVCYLLTHLGPLVTLQCKSSFFSRTRKLKVGIDSLPRTRRPCLWDEISKCVTTGNSCQSLSP